MVTHLEPEILQCEVKWALGSIITNKASRGDDIPAELLRSLKKKKKNDAVTVLHSICQQIWKTQQWPQDWKRSVFIPITKKGNAKECSNYRTIALISQYTCTAEGNGKPLQYFCLENPMNSMNRQNDRILKGELPGSVGAQYATGDQWRNNSRKNEGMSQSENNTQLWM